MRIFRWWMLLEQQRNEHLIEEEKEAEQLTSEGARGARDVNYQNEEGQPRASRAPEQERDGEKGEGEERKEGDEEKEGYSGEGEGEGEGKVLPGEINADEGFAIQRVSVNELKDRFYRFIEKVAEIPLKTEEPGFERYSMKKLLLRRFTKASLQSCKVSRARESVVVILDNSGSMFWWMENILKIASVALSRKDVEVYIAPNGIITKVVWAGGEQELAEPPRFVNRVIVYIGDFDGTNTVVELSWHNTVFWFCPETRYRRFMSHSWVNYRERDFKGMFFRVWDLNEFADALRRALPFRRVFIDYHANDTFDDD